jgi:hypothetical protein
MCTTNATFGGVYARGDARGPHWAGQVAIIGTVFDHMLTGGRRPVDLYAFVNSIFEVGMASGRGHTARAAVPGATAPPTCWRDDPMWRTGPSPIGGGMVGSAADIGQSSYP